MRFFKTKKGIIIAAASVLLFILLIRYIIAESTVFYTPSYEKSDICSIISNKNYDAIFAQTGISPDMAKQIIENGDDTFLIKMQEAYFKAPAAKKIYIAFPVTLEERRKNDAAPVVPLKKGDILITFNTRTVDWRHGHCGLVLDDNGTSVLEHMAIGETSCITDSSHWKTYPSFIVLRHPDSEIAQNAADYAKENLVDIPYNIFAGIVKKDKTGEEKPTSHCSHIVWQAYKSQDVDIDENKGLIVTPRDISNSKELQVVQIFGVNPEKYENRLLK